jgi:hypothetical protein
MNSDYTIIGNDLPAFIYGLKLLRKNKTVQIINDNEVSYPNFFMNILGSIEISMIENMGRSNSVKTLENINKYLMPKEIIFSIDDKKLLTGSGPDSVLVELFRKLPFLFNSSSIVKDYSRLLVDKACCSKLNQDFEHYNNLLGKQLSLYSSRQSYTLKIISENCPKLLYDLFVLFSDIAAGNVKITDTEMACFKSLLSSLKLIFQNEFSFNNNDFELFHLVNCLLTKNYIINHDALLNDLNNEFINSGGKFIKGKITNWKPLKRKVWELEIAKASSLSSLNLIVAGDWPDHYPVHFKKNPHYFSAVTVCAVNSVSLNNYTYIINNTSDNNLNFPISIYEVNGTRINATYFTRSGGECNANSGEHLYVEQFNNDICNLFASNYNQIRISNVINNGKIKGDFSHNKFLSKLRKIRFEKKSSIYFQQLHERKKKSKYLSYLGPLDKRGSGGIFLLGIIKDEIDFI